MVIKERWLLLGVFVFLFLPIVIFCVGFMKLFVGIPLSLVFVFVLYKIFKKSDKQIEMHIGKGELIGGIVIVLIWVWLSGIGGYAFQNYDHNGRNAILRDLVSFDWPVYYLHLQGIQTTSGQQPLYALIYYIGYWMPSALTGKIFGLNSAFFMLYIWTAVGIALVVLLLKKKLKTSIFFILLILVFFSGMDAIGALVLSSSIPGHYPGLWPPITHLEWWLGEFQDSSNTTQLFWVFNQAIPTWICVALYLAFPNPRRMILYWSICFFYAPLPALGLLPIIIFEMIRNTIHFGGIHQEKQRIDCKNKFFVDLRSFISVENSLGGGTVFLISYFYFSSNQSPSTLQITKLNWASFSIYVVFLLLEGILIWFLFAKEKYRDPIWYLVGALLIIWPLFLVQEIYNQGSRLTIPALFILMVWVMEGLMKKKWSLRPILIGYLVIGALTPLYEINRSIYRTTEYYLWPSKNIEALQLTPLEVKNILIAPENDHPGVLLADGYGSLSNFPFSELKSYVGNIQGTFLQKYLFKSP